MSQPDSRPEQRQPFSPDSASSDGRKSPGSRTLAAEPGTAAAIDRWIQNHDDSRLFAVLYIGLALVLSIVLGLFWLVAEAWQQIMAELKPFPD
jgi:hypothetical protein